MTIARHPGEGRDPDGPGLRGLLAGPRVEKGLDTGLRRYDGWKPIAASLLFASEAPRQ